MLGLEKHVPWPEALFGLYARGVITPFVIKTSPLVIESHDGSAVDRSMGAKHFVKELGKDCDTRHIYILF